MLLLHNWLFSYHREILSSLQAAKVENDEVKFYLHFNLICYNVFLLTKYFSVTKYFLFVDVILLISAGLASQKKCVLVCLLFLFSTSGFCGSCPPRLVLWRLNGSFN